MTNQLMLSQFTEKTISMDESTKGFRPWNTVILDWEVEYRGYSRGDSQQKGYLDFHVIVEMREALVSARKGNTYKKLERPGYKLTVTQERTFEGREQERSIVHEESFQKDQIKIAFDAFQREVINIQSWIKIAESRARIIPQENDIFECYCCGWVTDIWSDDITCQGCGKRYWSEKLWKRNK